MTELLQDEAACALAENRDDAIVDMLRRRDADGMTRLLDDHAGVVRRLLQQQFGSAMDEHQVDDVLSLASQRVWENIDGFARARGTLRAWFYVIARNIGRRMLRRDRAAGLTYRCDLDLAAATEPEPPAFVAAGTDAVLGELRRCIRALPRLQREVVLADLAAGGSAPAGPLARALHTTGSSIYASRSQARSTLRAALRELMRTPPVGCPRPHLAAG